jgi:hypothetical protein
MKRLTMVAVVLAVLGIVCAQASFANSRTPSVEARLLQATVGQTDEAAAGGAEGRRWRPGPARRHGDGEDGRLPGHRVRRGLRIALRALVVTQDAELGRLMEQNVTLTGQMHDLVGRRHALYGRMVRAAKAGDREKLKELAEAAREVGEKLKALGEKLRDNLEAIHARLEELKPVVREQMREFHRERRDDGDALEDAPPPALD